MRKSVEECSGRFYDVLKCLRGGVLPLVPECGRLSVTGDAEADAAATRHHLGVEPVGPVLDLVGGVLKNHGILFVTLEGADARFSGINGFDDEVRSSGFSSPTMTSCACRKASCVNGWNEAHGGFQQIDII